MSSSAHAKEPTREKPGKENEAKGKVSKQLKSSTDAKPEKELGWNRTSYFSEKQKKLTAQAPAAVTHILNGVKVYFTGVKSTSQRRLERLVWENGGEVLKVWYRKQVTHVVADCLAASKIEKELSLSVSQRGQAVIVKPKWLEDSLRERKKLAPWEYQVVRHGDIRDVGGFFRTNKTIKKARKNTKGK
ncbi:BRCT domain containing protein [Gracilaria domingensis]|nr:BRCT domain containing protein [Gracilaria domingensis]